MCYVSIWSVFLCVYMLCMPVFRYYIFLSKFIFTGPDFMSVNVKTHDISNDSEDKEEDKTAKSEAIC